MVFLLAAMSVALSLGTGIALAAAISGTQGDDTLRGTEQADQIYGLNGGDELFGLDGGDELYGGSGLDNLFGGSGADFINSADRGFDRINCGGADRARDRVIRDAQDEFEGCRGRDIVRPK